MDKNARKLIILACTLFILAFYAYFSLLIEPLEESIAELQRDLEKGQRELILLRKIEKSQEKLSKVMAFTKMKQRTFDSSLLSKIEDMVKRLDLSEKAIDLRPIPVSDSIDNAKEEKLQIRFVKMGLTHILEFLDSIESLPTNVRIEKLDIRKTGKTATMTLIISSLLFGMDK